jgi:hypothetical protein
MHPAGTNVKAITNRNRPDLYRVAGLIAACPVTGDNPPHCPLAPVRNLPGPSLTEWLFALTHRQIVAIERRHDECYKQCRTDVGRRDRSDRTI